MHRVLRYAAHVEYNENTLENPAPDGGWSSYNLGTAACSNVQANPTNGELNVGWFYVSYFIFLFSNESTFASKIVESCTVQTKNTVVGPICTYWGGVQENVVVCGSPGEVASRPDLNVKELNIFRPSFSKC